MTRPAPATVTPQPDLLLCDGCAAVYRRVRLASGQTARCRRCGDPLGRGHAMSLEGQLALALAALIVFLVANLSTVVELNLRGVRSSSTLMGAVMATWDAGQETIAAIAFATAFFFPLAVILLRLYVLAPLTAGMQPPYFIWAMRALRHATRWSMLEVFMLGTLIALVRSANLAIASPGPGIFAFAALALLLTAHQAAGLHGIWWRSVGRRA
jgi:paraquat-inducible protein A